VAGTRAGGGGEREQATYAAVKLTRAAVPESVTELRRKAAAFAADQGADRGLVDDVALAVSEIVTNAVKYAYGSGAEGVVELEAAAEDGLLDIRVRDRGCGFGEGSTDGLGLGLAIVARLCDDLRIVQEGAGTEVRMRFALSEAGGADAV
jgi:stage II sporulation protein AB (anti-sigma F factor)